MHETLKQSKASLAQSLWQGRLGLGGHKILLESSKYLWQVMGLDSKCNFAPPTILLGLLLCPWNWDIFFLVDSNILLSMVV